MATRLQFWLVAALGMCTAQAGAVELTVEDPTGCVDGDAVREQLVQVVADAPLMVVLAVLPEGEQRFVTLQWAGLGEREVAIPSADCEELPMWVRLTTERAIAALPGGLEALIPPPRWTARAGAAVGTGIPWTPEVGGMLQVHQGRRVAALYGFSAEVGTQAVGSGGVWTLGGHFWFGAAIPTGPIRLDVATGAGVIRGQGRNLDSVDVAVLPQLRGRVAAVRIIDRTELGLALESPILSTVWVAEGVGRSPEPAVRASLCWQVRLGR